MSRKPHSNGTLDLQEMRPENHEELRCQGLPHLIDLWETVPREKACPKRPNQEPLTQPSPSCPLPQDVIEVSKKFLPGMAIGYSSSKLTLHVGDGFEFMKQNQDAFDVIITDSSDPMGEPGHVPRYAAAPRLELCSPLTPQMMETGGWWRSSLGLFGLFTALGWPASGCAVMQSGVGLKRGSSGAKAVGAMFHKWVQHQLCH